MPWELTGRTDWPVVAVAVDEVDGFGSSLNGAGSLHRTAAIHSASGRECVPPGLNAVLWAECRPYSPDERSSLERAADTAVISSAAGPASAAGLVGMYVGMYRTRWDGADPVMLSGRLGGTVRLW